jgi:hypothetical protein
MQMNPDSRIAAHLLRIVVGVGLAASLLGCSRKLTQALLPNRPPEVVITEAPMDTTVQCDPGPSRSCYSVTVRWTGFDPDGQVSHYLVAIDPTSTDTAWTSTRISHYQTVLSASVPVPRGPLEIPKARDFHVFVVAAVDNQGAIGPREWRAFFSYTQAPDVMMIQPLPNRFTAALLTPSVRLRWTGTDEDGVFSQKPVKYKYLLLTPSSDYPLASAWNSPDSLMMASAPGFAGWDSVGGDTTEVQYANLSHEQEYLFVVVAIDEAGAYTPVLDPNSNMLRFRVRLGANLGPRITAFSEFFDYTWSPSYCPNCPTNEFDFEMPAGRSLVIDWSAVANTGGDMRGYRWALDIEDVYDDTERENDRDLSRWSSLSLNQTHATIGPFNPATMEDHRFFIEASDNVGLRSLAVLRFTVVPPDFRPGSILIVKDTRLPVDNLDRVTNCVAKPKAGQVWPTQAELDTFLFARGGHPWRCLPAGTKSRPGIFAGYSFDTLGTRTRKTDLGVRLATLARYQHVIWIVDAKGATFFGSGLSAEPMTSLRYMCESGHFNSLAAYVRLGGKAWLLGGGGGFASTYPWNVSSNDAPTIRFSNALGELLPGRMMHDISAWRSEFRVSSSPASVRRFTGRIDANPDPSLPYMPYVGELPRIVEFKSPVTDTMPAWRTNSGDFFRTVAGIEYLQVPNDIVEALGVGDTVSTLDTLYEAVGPDLPGPAVNPHNVLMTFAHGAGSPQGFLFTGFDIWTFKRTHCKAIVDFVLRRMWNLTPRAAASGSTARR